MRVTGSAMPTSSFVVERKNGNTAVIRFYDNVEQDDTQWKYDEYVITRPYRDQLESDIESNFDAWLTQAKYEDEHRTPIDVYQLRADTDYLEVTQSAMMGISVMSLASDPAVLELARKYYPLRWSEERLRALVGMQKITPEDFEAVTGVAYSTEVAG